MQTHQLLKRRGLAKTKTKCKIHKFVTASWNEKFFQCVEPACTTFLLKQQCLGKFARCHECNDPFILDGYSMARKHPKCQNCRGTKHLDTVLDDLFKETPKDEYPEELETEKL